VRRLIYLTNAFFMNFPMFIAVLGNCGTGEAPHLRAIVVNSHAWIGNGQETVGPTRRCATGKVKLP
jgi:hypothetical protein